MTNAFLLGEAADVDDPAAAALFEVRNGGVTAVKDAGEIRVEHAVPFLHRRLGDGLEHANAGVVDQDVEAAELLRAAVVISASTSV